jgi:hypothetical protein
MKLKNLLLGLSLLLSTVALAQDQGVFRGFAGITYPLASGADLGATAGVEYAFAEGISVAPSYTYYFSGNGITNSDIDLDLRYFLGSDDFNWFVSAGASMANVSVSGAGSNSETGFATGVGAFFSVGNMYILSTVKYNSNRGGNIIPMLGVSFRI